MIFAQDEPPDVGHGQAEMVVFFQIGASDKQSEIDEPFVQAFGNIFVVSAVQMEADVRMSSDQRFHGADENAHAFRFSASDIHVPPEGALVRAERRLRSVGKFDDLLRMPAQKFARFGQLQSAPAAFEQFFAEFVFKLHQLLGERRLCDMQRFCRSRDIAFPRHRKEIPQHPKFHWRLRVPVSAPLRSRRPCGSRRSRRKQDPFPALRSRRRRSSPRRNAWRAAADRCPP